MAGELQMEELQLPADLLDELFFVEREGRRPAVDVNEEGDHLAALSRQMAHAFLHDDGSELKVGDPWDRFNVAAEKAAMRSKLLDAGHRRWSHHERGLHSQQRNPCPGMSAGPLLSQHQLQAARIFHLKHRQLVLRQQLCAAMETQSRATNYRGSRRGRSLGLPPPGWSPPQMQHRPLAGSESRAVFFLNSGRRKESVGTGVFLPQTAGSKAVPPKKSACSTVLIPARVVQALNMNLEDLSAQARIPVGFVHQHDAFVGRSNFLRSHLRQQPSATRTPRDSFPQEWTY
ncbi:hypothetical protein Cni_G15697 [Canna indica]|uniref:Uncharacterized protein n=1 Tax=Canna indica TaxID=4628 RepID=A0AAQ3KIC0_9LILI|nr:hypothetical protein Cni_G15697 [Canna indica]